jgi:hypothetical protein
VIGADDIAILQIAERQFGGFVRAAILHGVGRAVGVLPDDDVFAQEAEWLWLVAEVGHREEAMPEAA